MLEKFIDAAIGNKKAETVLKNGSFVNVFTGEIVRADIAIEGGKIVGFGEYEGETEYDISGKIAVPGLIDAHVHIESSQLSPEEFAKLVLPRGTTTVVADPHEITNVCGIAGAQYIAQACARTPLEAKVMLPSCVPATAFETSGAVLTGADTEKYIREDFIYGLGEFMNYPGVIYKDKEVLRKLEAAHAADKVIDGHAPDTHGKGLNAYLSAGISTDHECTSPEEALEKVSKGVYVHLREGSATRNVAANCKAVNAYNLRRFLCCTELFPKAAYFSRFLGHQHLNVELVEQGEVQLLGKGSLHTNQMPRRPPERQRLPHGLFRREHPHKGPFCIVRDFRKSRELF